MTLAELYDLVPLGLLRGAVIVFGLLWGSFLNVVIHRVPRGMSVVHPPSHCPACGAPVKAYDNLPIVSYVVLRGRARCCGARMSPRYLVVEAIGGALALALLESTVFALPGTTPLLHAALLFLTELALALGLVAAAFIDAEHMYLPDTITIGGTVLGLLTAKLRGLPFEASIVGAGVGFAGIWVPFVWLYAKLRGRPGMGLGDAKLLALAGAWFGWIGAVFALFAGAIQGTIGALALYLVRGKIDEPEAVRAEREELRRLADAGDDEARRELEEDPLGEPQGEGLGQARLPFGPFLILGCLELLFAQARLLDAARTWLHVD